MDRSQCTCRIRLLMAASIFIVNACGTARAYSGPERPRDQIALIKPAGLFDLYAKIERVDQTMVWLYDNSVEVEPGRHIVTLSIEFATGGPTKAIAHGNVELDAVAGATYEAHGDSTGFIPLTHWFWIVDAATHEVVAGCAPPK